MADPPVLTFMSGPDDGSVIQPVLPKSISAIIFGRVPSCAVALPYDPSVSRQHSRLFWRENAWWLEDMGSTNGTFVGEFAQSVKVVEPVRLSTGQVFKVGRTRFRLESPDENYKATSGKAQATA